MFKQIMPGVYAGVPEAVDREHAARQWYALAAALHLAPDATATGVLTEMHILQDLAMLTPAGAEYVLREDMRVLRQNGGAR